MARTHEMVVALGFGLAACEQAGSSPRSTPHEPAARAPEVQAPRAPEPTTSPEPEEPAPPGPTAEAASTLGDELAKLASSLMPGEIAKPAPWAEPAKPAGAPVLVKAARRSVGRERVPRASELPTPPSTEPAAYAAWLRELTPQQRRGVGRFCNAHRRDYQEICGGIGPLQIPKPPFQDLRDRPPGEEEPPGLTFEQWYEGLTVAQRAYVERECQPGQGSSDLCGVETPLVVVLGDEPVRYTAGGGAFAFAPGVPVATDWPTAATPWLALDRDGDGAIASGAELFGNHTALPGGERARHGFEALAALDANGDGRIDAEDPAFERLLLWADRDGDRASSPDELAPASGVLTSISLDYEVDVRCDERRNCERERAGATLRDGGGAVGAGAVVDVYLQRR